jgi:hypothetical protein
LDNLFGLDELAHQPLDSLSCLCLDVRTLKSLYRPYEALAQF